MCVLERLYGAALGVLQRQRCDHQDAPRQGGEHAPLRESKWRSPDDVAEFVYALCFVLCVVYCNQWKYLHFNLNSPRLRLCLC